MRQYLNSTTLYKAFLLLLVVVNILLDPARNAHRAMGRAGVMVIAAGGMESVLTLQVLLHVQIRISDLNNTLLPDPVKHGFALKPVSVVSNGPQPLKQGMESTERPKRGFHQSCGIGKSKSREKSKIGKNRLKLEKLDIGIEQTFWQKCQNAIKCQNACTSGQGPASEYFLNAYNFGTRGPTKVRRISK